VVEQIMGGARENFRPVVDGQQGVLVERLELQDAAVGTLPEADRRFGADQLVVVLVSVTFGGEYASGGINGTTEPVAVLDGDGNMIGPAGEYTAAHFDLDAPKDPEFLAWGARSRPRPLGTRCSGA
jgi:hypothetical protein